MMRSIAICVLSCLLLKNVAANVDDDSIPEAITVYRNPQFFKKIHYESDRSVYEFSDGDADDYSDFGSETRYPGEPKKPNPSASPGFEVNYDNSPEFHHEPREVFHDPERTPKRGRGPYGHPRVEDEDREIEIEESEPISEIENEESEPINEVENEENNEEEAEETANEDESESEETNEESADEVQNDEESRRNTQEETYETYEPNQEPAEDKKFLPTYYHTFRKPENEESEEVVDRKKGTREYYRHHKRPEEDAEDRRKKEEDEDLEQQYENLVDVENGPFSTEADTKLVFKKLFVPRKIKPVLLLSYKSRPKHKKFKIKFKKPKKFLHIGKRDTRKVLENAIVDVNSDFDLQHQRI